MTLQPLGHVVGVEDGHLGGVNQAPGPHHLHTQTHTHTHHSAFNVLLVFIQLFILIVMSNNFPHDCRPLQVTLTLVLQAPCNNAGNASNCSY